MERIPALIRWYGTFLILNLTWVIFRAETLTDATRFFGRLFAGSPAMGGLTAAFQLPEITALFRFGLNRMVPSLMPKLVGAVFYAGALWLATRRENVYDAAEDLKPSIHTLGFTKFCFFTFCLTLLYCTVFFVLETFNFFNWVQWLLQVGGSTLVTFVMIITFDSVSKK